MRRKRNLPLVFKEGYSERIGWELPDTLKRTDYWSVAELCEHIKSRLKHYGISLYTFWEETGFYEEFAPVDKSTFYRWFSKSEDHIDMPIELIQCLPECLRKLRVHIENPEKKKAYLEEINELKVIILRYVKACLFEPKCIRELMKLRHEEVLGLFDCIMFLNFSSETWYFWLCYSVLKEEKQAEIADALKALCSLVNIPRYEKLFSFWAENKEDFLELHYVKQKKINDKRAWAEALGKYAQKFPDKIVVWKRINQMVHVLHSVSDTEWTVLLSYEYLLPDIYVGRIKNYVLALMYEKSNLRRLWDKKVQEDVIKSLRELLIDTM